MKKLIILLTFCPILLTGQVHKRSLLVPNCTDEAWKMAVRGTKYDCNKTIVLDTIKTLPPKQTILTLKHKHRTD